jgi:hypothetical protein
MPKINKRSIRPTPALVVAFVALFAAMGGFGYAAVKMKPYSVKSKNIKPGAVTTDKLADGAVTTPKLAPDAVAPNAVDAVNAMNAAKLGGKAPGECQTGWLKASIAVDTAPLTPTLGEPMVFPGFDCASKGDDAIQITRNGVGVYTVDIAGNDADVAVTTSGGTNTTTAATKTADGEFLVKTWKNSDATFVDGSTFQLVAF